jgi:hypothetical protein
MQLRLGWTDGRQSEVIPSYLSMSCAPAMISVMRTSSSPVPDCPLAPPSRQTTYARTLHRACLILGGTAQLATHLAVAESAVRVWLEGRQEPPEDVFLAAVEIILLDAESPRRAT